MVEQEKQNKLKHLLLASLFFLLPLSVQAGFPQDKDGYDIEKIKEAFRLPCKDIGKDECISRALGIGACTWIFEVNRGVENVEALKTGDSILMALVQGNELDLNTMYEKDGSIKLNIKREAVNRINFCREETKKAIPKMVKLPEGMELNEERIESLANTFPNQYLYMFEQMKKGKN